MFETKKKLETILEAEDIVDSESVPFFFCFSVFEPLSDVQLLRSDCMKVFTRV